MKFSVIVPVYGVEKYLDRCIESVLAQSFHNFELILVDDCSPDRCPEICDEWAKRDPRVRVIHKPVNEGLGFARNTGMKVVSGDYVLFLDSDDYVAQGLLDKCNEALTEQTDILVFGVQSVYENSRGRVKYTESAVPQMGFAKKPREKADVFAQLNRCGCFPFAWNKVYRSAFLLKSGVVFEQTKLIEDFLFNIALFEQAERIDVVSTVLYYYRRPVHETLVSKYAPEFFALVKRKYCLEENFLRRCDGLTPDNIALIKLGYLKHLVSVVLKNRSKSAGLNLLQQMKRVCEIMNDPMTVEIVRDYCPADWKFRLIRNAVYHRKVSLMLLYSIGIGFVQKRLLVLYRRILKS